MSARVEIVEAANVLEDWLIDHHWPNSYDLSHALLASDWLDEVKAIAHAECAAEVSAAVEAIVTDINETDCIRDRDLLIRIRDAIYTANTR